MDEKRAETIKGYLNSFVDRTAKKSSLPFMFISENNQAPYKKIISIPLENVKYRLNIKMYWVIDQLNPNPSIVGGYQTITEVPVTITGEIEYKEPYPIFTKIIRFEIGDKEKVIFGSDGKVIYRDEKFSDIDHM